MRYAVGSQRNATHYRNASLPTPVQRGGALLHLLHDLWRHLVRQLEALAERLGTSRTTDEKEL